MIGRRPRHLGDDLGAGRGQFGRRRRIVGEEAFAQTDTSHLEGDGGQIGVVGTVTRHQLGRAAADVEHQERTLGRVEVGHGAGQRQPPLVDPGQELGQESGGRSRPPEEVVAVGGVAGGRRGGQATTVDTESVHDLAVLDQDGNAPLDRLGGQAPGGIDPLAQAGDPHQALERPALGVGHQQTGRIGAAVNGGDGRSEGHATLLARAPGAHHPRAGPSPRRQAGCRPIRRAVHSPTGSSAPVNHHARWACRHLTPSRVPPTPPDGRGPVWPGSISASRSAA